MINKQTYIKIKFGAFEYEGDIAHLEKTVVQTLRLREAADMTEYQAEPEEEVTSPTEGVEQHKRTLSGENPLEVKNIGYE